MTIHIAAKPAAHPFDVVIKRGIPIPEPRNKSDSRLYGIARKMQVGDCIEIPYSRTGHAANLERSLGYTFTQRKVGDVLRIWRTA